MRAFLITGAAGHLASITIDMLRRQNCLIRGLILPNETGMDEDNIRYFKGDVTEPETLNDFFCGLEQYQVIVLHMAAVISIQNKVSPEIYAVNVLGTKNILEKCREHGVSRLVYVSSVHAIPEPDELTLITEIDRFSKNAVQGAYAKTKAEATQMVLDAGREGMDVVVVHPSGIVGPGDSGRNHMTQLILMYLQHALPFVVNGGYDFVDVRDVAAGIIAAVELGRRNACYLLTNRFVPIPELIEHARIAAGRSDHSRTCPIWLAKAAIPIIDAVCSISGRRPIFTLHSLKTLETKARFCHDKAAMELGFTPRDIRQTVSDTVEYLQKNSAAEIEGQPGVPR